VRWPRGDGIAAACGQLRLHVEKDRERGAGGAAATTRPA